MKQLFLAFYRKLEATDMRFERYLKGQVEWNNCLIAITGARGTGKTTMLLQHIKERYGDNPQVSSNAGATVRMDNETRN